MKTIVCLGLLALMAVSTAQAENLEGPAFGDPSHVTPMPEDWINSPVSYDQGLEQADLVISLGQQTYPALKDAVAKYAKSRNLNIVVQQGTCGVTNGKLIRKSIDVGAFCCPPGKNDRFPGLEFHTLGIAPIALVTHPDNPLEDLSLEDARKVFKGEYSRWSEVKSNRKKVSYDNMIQPVARLHCKPRYGHWRTLLDNEDLFSPRTYEVGVIPDMVKQISRNKAAIGYETLFMLKVHKDHGTVKALSIDGHHPADHDYALAGKYPFYRTYSLTTWSEGKKQLSEELIQYLMTYVEENYREFGFIPASQLRRAGWKFRKNELVGKPEVVAGN